MYRRSAVSFLLATVALLAAASGHAAPRDAAATQKIDEAINSYYLATEFDKAEALLKGVVEACEDRCSPNIKARAWMYVGIVEGSGRQSAQGAQEAFQQALALDPNVKLDEALATPEVKQAFSAAAAALGQAPASGGGGGGEAAAAGGDEGGGADAAAGGEGGAVPGNMECTPNVKDVEMQRPIPIACTTDEPAVKVTLRYLVFGGSQWQQVQMTKKGEYWQGEIPCSETGVSGKLRYYVQAKDKDDEELDSHGSKKAPAEISIVASTTEEPPAYPGQAAPQKCMAASECPEEMIGTPACPTAGSKGGRGSKGWGAPCDTSQECDSGLLCMQGDSGRTCESAPKCDSDSECPTGSVCKSGTCDVSDDGGGSSSSPSGPFKKNLVGLHFAADFAFMGSGHDVCLSPNFGCYWQTGQPFTGKLAPGAAGGLNGGATLGTMRVLLSYERLFSQHFGLEGRLGYAFNGGPPAANGVKFLPIHAEARAKLWLGKSLFTKKGLRPYVFLGGGIAQVDAALTVNVIAKVPNSSQTTWQANAYRKLGQAFVGGGLGAMYAFAPKHGVLLNLNADYMLGNSGLVLEPSVGYEVGF